MHCRRSRQYGIADAGMTLTCCLCCLTQTCEGALYVESCKFLDVAACSFTDNRVRHAAKCEASITYSSAMHSKHACWLSAQVLRHAGGAVRVVDGPATALQTPATLFNCSFLRNKAVMGGAVALSRWVRVYVGGGGVRVCGDGWRRGPHLAWCTHVAAVVKGAAV